MRQSPTDGVGSYSRTGSTPGSYGRRMVTRAACVVRRGCGNRLLATPLRIDEVAVRKHRRVRKAASDCGAMKLGRLSWTQFQKDLDRQCDDTQVVQLANDRKDVGDEVQRRNHISQSQHWQQLR